jgi:hypothetical protein
MTKNVIFVYCQFYKMFGEKIEREPLIFRHTLSQKIPFNSNLPTIDIPLPPSKGE